MVYLGFIPMEKLLERGINVSLGADSAAAANSLDMFKEMRTAALIHKGHHADPAIVPAERVLEMGTINGARTLGLEEEVGSLEPGKKADVIIVDTNQASFAPQHDIVSQLVYCASGKDVETVIVDGEILMEDGETLVVDEEQTIARVKELAKQVLERQGIDVSQRYPER